MNPFRLFITIVLAMFTPRAYALDPGLASFTTNSATTTDNLIGSNGDNLLGRKYTLISGQNVVRGTVLGKITASGKLNKSLSAASDGSEVPYAIAEHDCDATSGDKDILAYVQGSFNENALTIGTAHTVATVRAAFLAGGRIMLETPVKKYP
jgi:hypothetical protein